MGSEVVRIEELRLRIPGISADEARQLGDEVAHRIAAGLRRDGPSEQLGSLDLRISVPKATSKDELAEHIASRILGALK